MIDVGKVGGTLAAYASRGGVPLPRRESHCADNRPGENVNVTQSVMKFQVGVKRIDFGSRTPEQRPTKPTTNGPGSESAGIKPIFDKLGRRWTQDERDRVLAWLFEYPQ